MLKKLAIIGLGVGLALAASSALSWGGSGAKLPSKAETFQPRAAHPVESPSGRVASRTTRGSRPHLKFFETNNFSIPADGRDDSSLRCPRTYKAITGYFGTDGGIFPDYLAQGPSGLRRWDFGLQDLSGQPGHAFIGIVCHK
jgi:hypothetical protein